MTHQPSARIEGVTVQRMFSSKDAVELILGIKKDKVFGTVLMVGVVYVFIYASRYMGIPPVVAAWLPILVFGSLGAVMLDSVKT